MILAHNRWQEKRSRWCVTVGVVTSLIQPLIQIICDYNGRYGYGNVPIHLRVRIPSSITPTLPMSRLSDSDDSDDDDDNDHQLVPFHEFLNTPIMG
jgi:hypothetical protein